MRSWIAERSRGRVGFWQLWCAGVLAAASLSVLAAAFPYFPGDLPAARALQSVEAPWAQGTEETADVLGNALLAVSIGTVAVLACLYLGEARLGALTASLVAARLAGIPLKLLVERPRPSEPLLEVREHASGYSFPSGHALGAILLYGGLMVLVYHLVPQQKLRWAPMALLGAVVALVGLERVYDGAHFPSDVTGGYLVGALILGALVWLYRPVPRWAQPRQS